MKAAVFHPAAFTAIRLFPDEVRRELGKAIFDLQRGEKLAMPLSRPMSSVASGVEELRIRDRHGIYRALYYTRSPREVLVIHAFVKKTSTTAQDDIAIARKRLKEIL